MKLIIWMCQWSKHSCSIYLLLALRQKDQHGKLLYCVAFFQQKDFDWANEAKKASQIWIQKVSKSHNFYNFQTIGFPFIEKSTDAFLTVRTIETSFVTELLIGIFMDELNPKLTKKNYFRIKMSQIFQIFDVFVLSSCKSIGYNLCLFCYILVLN